MVSESTSNLSSRYCINKDSHKAIFYFYIYTYTYVPEALIEEYKTKCSYYAWAFKTIENDLPAQYR